MTRFEMEIERIRAERREADHKRTMCNLNDIRAMMTGCSDYERTVRMTSFPSDHYSADTREILIGLKVLNDRLSGL